MKLYLGKFTLEGTPQEIKEVLDLMGIEYKEIPVTIPTYPTIPDPQPWSPYNPNIWWWTQPYCTAQTSTVEKSESNVGLTGATNNAEINVEEPVKMTEAEWETKKRIEYLEKLKAWNQIMGNDGQINCTVATENPDVTNTISKGEIK